MAATLKQQTRKVRGKIEGTGYKIRTQLESAFSHGVSLPVCPDGMTAETYPAVCLAFGTLDLRTAVPFYVPTRDEFHGLPKSVKLDKSGESFTGDRAEFFEAKNPTPNSLATAIRTYVARYGDSDIAAAYAQMIVVGIPASDSDPAAVAFLLRP